MRIQEAAALLGQMYHNAPKDEKVVQIHLFGIKSAEQIEGMSGKELAILAGIPVSYATEIAKGRRLARHVLLRD